MALHVLLQYTWNPCFNTDGNDNTPYIHVIIPTHVLHVLGSQTSTIQSREGFIIILVLVVE